MQRPTTNYFEKPMDLIFKSTKLIFVQPFSTSRDFSAGRNHLPGTARSLELVPVPELQLEMGAEVPGDGGSATLVGAKLEQPPRDFMSMREVQLLSSSSGTGNSVGQSSFASLWFHLGSSLSSENSLQNIY